MAEPILDDISQQLKSEILSLENYIERTEDRLLATQWTSDLLDPLEVDAEELTEADLTTALTALHQAKAKFDVNGRVGGRIDEILKKYASLLPEELLAVEEGGEEEDVVLSIDAGVDSDAFPEIADSLFEEEEEEEEDFTTEPDPALFDLGQTDREDGAETAQTPNAASFAFAGLIDEEEEEDPDGADASPLVFNEFGDDPAEADALDADDETEDSAPAPGFERLGDEEATSPAVGGGGSSDDLFADSSPGIQTASGESPDSSTRQGLQFRREDETDHIRAAKGRLPEPRQDDVDIFAHKISLEDVQAALDLSVQKQDLVQLQQRLRAKLDDKVVAALRASKLAEKQLTLIPRIGRFVHKGVSQPCTVLTLAKAFPALFGQIQELGRYRGSGFMTSETPEPGWALISQESPREGIGKNYMEQNQYLRYLASSLGIPSHLIRRRTMVEAVYDLLVSRMTLGLTPQRQTLDWTSTSPSRNDYICVYFAEEGLRVRDLTRTTRHSSLGVCPNW